jgi:hypothetical protein
LSTFGATAQAGDAANRLVVHEWGTFTALQNEKGEELTGVNIDDEPVPDFVHNLHPFILGSPIVSSQHWRYRQKGAPSHHPLVTVRLETPVIYFHPPQGMKLPRTLDVSVQFRGGWLTEFYPNAEASAPGLDQGLFRFGKLTPETVGGLDWRNVQIGTDGVGPQTDEHVWLAPRDVQAANVTTPEGESERYLFYRGVGNLRAPLRVTTDREMDQLSIYANFDEVLSSTQSVTIPALWLADIRADGSSAYRRLGPVEVTADLDKQLAQVSSAFQADDYACKKLVELQAEMHKQLVASGLNGDEATALLSTWQRAYFTSPGLRLFFLVPEEWTNHYLPLSISVDAEVSRVMVGRIELIADQQRALLDRLAQTSPSDPQWIGDIPESEARERFFSGHSTFGNLGVEIPADYQMYLALGRFRNALVTAQERATPTENLTTFINNYSLHPFRWDASEKAEKE